MAVDPRDVLSAQALAMLKRLVLDIEGGALAVAEYHVSDRENLDVRVVLGAGPGPAQSTSSPPTPAPPATPGTINLACPKCGSWKTTDAGGVARLCLACDHQWTLTP